MDNSIDEIICTSHEGGHNDHGAVSMIAKALAIKFHAKVLEFYLYNGLNTKGKFYNVAFPSNVSQAITINYSLTDFNAFLIAPIIFKFQLKAMLGLWRFF